MRTSWMGLVVGALGISSLTACESLTGVKPESRASCQAVDRTDTLYKYVTPQGDTVLLGVRDSTGQVLGLIWMTSRVQIPACSAGQ